MTTWILALLLNATAIAGSETAFSTSTLAESRGDYAAALAALDRADGPAIDATVLSMRRGWLRYLAGAHEAAVTEYEDAVRRSPSAVEPRLGLTLPLMALRRWAEVLEQCDAILATRPGESTAAARRAWALYNLGRYAESERAYAALVADWPTDLDLRAGLGWAACQQGRTAAARAAFAQVLAMDPDHETATQGLAACVP